MALTRKKQGATAVCPLVYAPVVANDGLIYDNACLAKSAGQEVVGPAPYRTAPLGSAVGGRTSAEKWALAFQISGLLFTGIGIGVAIWAKRKKNSDLGYAKAGGPTDIIQPGVREHFDKKMPIEMRVRLAQGLVEKSIKDEIMGDKMRELALNITSKCPERDDMCEMRAIYNFVKSQVRYTGDIAPIAHSDGRYEAVDLFQAAYKTLQYHGGDCDDGAILNATLLSLNGIPARFRITAPRPNADWSHIYVLAGTPRNNPTMWIPIDTTLPGDRFGVEAPFNRKLDFVS
jgi:hypothetical protein